MEPSCQRVDRKPRGGRPVAHVVRHEVTNARVGRSSPELPKRAALHQRRAAVDAPQRNWASRTSLQARRAGKVSRVASFPAQSIRNVPMSSRTSYVDRSPTRCLRRSGTLPPPGSRSTRRSASRARTGSLFRFVGVTSLSPRECRRMPSPSAFNDQLRQRSPLARFHWSLRDGPGSGCGCLSGRLGEQAGAGESLTDRSASEP